MDFSLHGGKVYTGDGATMHGAHSMRGGKPGTYNSAPQQNFKQVRQAPLPPARSDMLPNVREEPELPRAAQVAMLSTRGVGECMF